MKLPFDRDRMRMRNLLDDIDEIARAHRLTPAERFVMALDLSETTLSLARGNPAGMRVPSESLAQKARAWTLPLGEPSR